MVRLVNSICIAMMVVMLSMVANAGEKYNPAQNEISVKFEISMAEDFTQKLIEDYGVREEEKLAQYLRRYIMQAFQNRGVSAEQINITLLDAKPNRPTMEQMRRKPGLSYHHSISIGGASISGTTYNAAGDIIAEADYNWFETNIHNVVGVGAWSDARRAMRRFAVKLAEDITDS